MLRKANMQIIIQWDLQPDIKFDTKLPGRELKKYQVYFMLYD